MSSSKKITNFFQRQPNMSERQAASGNKREGFNEGHRGILRLCISSGYSNTVVISYRVSKKNCSIFIQLIWPIKCQILSILTSTKYLQNLLRDGTLSVISNVKKISILGSLGNAKNAKSQFVFFWTPNITMLEEQRHLDQIWRVANSNNSII